MDLGPPKADKVAGLDHPMGDVCWAAVLEEGRAPLMQFIQMRVTTITFQFTRRPKPSRVESCRHDNAPGARSTTPLRSLPSRSARLSSVRTDALMCSQLSRRVFALQQV